MAAGGVDSCFDYYECFPLSFLTRWPGNADTQTRLFLSALSVCARSLFFFVALVALISPSLLSLLHSGGLPDLCQAILQEVGCLRHGLGVLRVCVRARG